MPQLKNPITLKVSIGANDGVGVDQQVLRQLADAGELITGLIAPV
jgi:hypothetical protein